MQRSDLDFCDELRRVAGWNQRREDWLRFLNLSKNGCFIAEIGGEEAGAVTTITYEGKTIGWIGMLIVHPSFRGSGVGSALLGQAIDFLRSERVESIKLDATPQGEPLYGRMGFSREFRITRWERNQGEVSGGEGVPLVREMELAEMDAVSRLDEAAFGARRSELLRQLRAEAVRAVVHTDGNGIGGFGMLRRGSVADYLGPVVASDEPVAERLISCLLKSSGTKVYWDCPESGKHRDAPLRFHFTAQRILTRMSLGKRIEPREPLQYWGLIDPACG